MLRSWQGRVQGWTWLESPPACRRLGTHPGLHSQIKTATEQQELKQKKSPGPYNGGQHLVPQ